MSNLSRVEMIQRNAELVIETMRKQGVDLGYDQKSVQWLDDFIEQQRQQNPAFESNINGWVNTFGSFLGECIRQQFGGEWKDTGHGLGIQINEDLWCYPFAKVRKQLENGPDDSILSFYGGISVLRDRKNWKRKSE